MRGQVVVGIVVALASWDASPADACSAPYGIVRESLPADGDVGVPTNVEVRVAYRGNVDAISTKFALRPVGGEPLELAQAVGAGTSFHAVRIQRPVAPLEPNTTYELLDRVVVPCGEFDCTRDSLEVFATFTTGPTADTVPPSFAGLTAVDSAFVPGMPDNSCGDYSSVVASLSWEPATDDGPSEWLRYRVTDGADRVYGAYLSGTGTTAQALCRGDIGLWPIDGHIEFVVGPLQVHAVDAAGNVDDNAVVLSTVGCDDELPPLVDAGAGPDGATSADPGGNAADCGCGTSGGRAPAGAWLVVAVALLLARRRQ